MIYSTTELELLGLCISIIQFKQLLAKLNFDCRVDHLALTYIIKGKTEPASNMYGFSGNLGLLLLYS